MSGFDQVSSGVRQRLAAPRGQRFSRPGANRQWAVPSELHRTGPLSSASTEPGERRSSRPPTAPPEYQRPQQHTALIELWGPHPAHSPTSAPESHQDRQERLLRQMEGNPHLAYRLQHEAVPHWTKATRQRQGQAQRQTRRPARPSSEPRPGPPSQPPRLPRPSRGRHRAPRRWWAWPAVAVSTALLFAQSQAESLGGAVFKVGFPI